MNMIFLVDGDNNIGTGLQGADQLTADDSILIFYQKTGLALGKIKELCKGSKASIQYLESVKGGKNSIDFQIITELGVLVGRGEADCAYVISQDKGYEAAMSALRVRYTGAFREVALRPSIAACLKASYLTRAASTEELRSSLKQEFGEIQGAAAFQHLQELFQPAPKAEGKPAAETAMEKPVKRNRGGRRHSSKSTEVKPADVRPENAEKPTRPAVQPAPQVRTIPEPAAAGVEEKPPVKLTRPRRGGRRKKKPAAEKPTEEA